MVLDLSCSNNSKPKVIDSGNVKYITKFDVEDELRAGKDLTNLYDLKGCVGIRSLDSIAIFYYYTGDYYWRVYNLQTNKLLAQLFPKGHGHDEASDVVVPGAIYKQNGHLYVQYTSNNEGEFEIIDLTSCINTGKIVISSSRTFSSKDFIQDVAMFNDSIFLTYTSTDNQVRRQALKGDSIFNYRWIDCLNIETDDLSTLSFIQRINYKSGLVAEAMLYLNQINLYSVRTNDSETLCFGDRLTNVNDVIDQSQKDRIRYFNSLTSCDKYLIASYVDQVREKYDSENNESSIMFISWDGAPLAKFLLNYTADAAFLYHEKLYVFSRHGVNEQLICYPIVRP